MWASGPSCDAAKPGALGLPPGRTRPAIFDSDPVSTGRGVAGEDTCWEMALGDLFLDHRLSINPAFIEAFAPRLLERPETEVAAWA